MGRILGKEVEGYEVRDGCTKEGVEEELGLRLMVVRLEMTGG